MLRKIKLSAARRPIISLLVPVLLAIGLVIITPMLAFAAGDDWVGHGPYGGDVTAIRVSPNFAVDTTILIGTANGVYKSTNSGSAWARCNLGITSFYTYSIAISPGFASDNTVYAGTSDGLFKSTNGGSTWTRIDSGFVTSYIKEVAISPDGGVIFAAADEWSLGTQCIYKSTNGGLTWTQSLAGQGGSSFSFSPNFAVDHTVFVGTGNGGVFESTNTGSNWTQVNTGLSYPYVPAMTISPNYAVDHTIFAGTGSGVYESTNSAQSWARVDSGFASVSVGALAISPNFATDNTIYAGTSNGLYKSTNRGQTWTQVDSGIAKTWIKSLDISPNGTTLLAGTYYAGIYKSTNGGSSWTEINTGIANTIAKALALTSTYAVDKTIFAGTTFGVYKSTDGGQSWNRTVTGLSSQLHIDSLAVSPNYMVDHTVFAGETHAIYESTDSGATWSQSLVCTYPTLAISPSFSSDHTVFAGVHGGVYRSTDGGSTWSKVDSGLAYTYMSSVALSPNYASDGTVFAGTADGRIYKSTNGGSSWSQVIGYGIEDLFVRAIAFSPNYAVDQTVFASIEGVGCFKSVDGGLNWTNLNNTIDALSFPLVLSPDYANDQTIFAGGYSGVYKSTNGGGSWTLISSGLTATDIMSLAISPTFATDYTVFAGTNYGGVFNTQDSDPPTKPSLSIVTLPNNDFKAYWTASNDPQSGVAGYVIRVNSTETTVTGLSHTFTPTPDTTYTVSVKAFDKCGNYSAADTNTIILRTTPAAPTPPGDDVAVVVKPASDIAPVTITFSTVNSTGETSVTVSLTNDAGVPLGFNLHGPYFELKTAASVTGKITVTVPFNGNALTHGQKLGLKLYHFEGGQWVDITKLVDADNNIITGETTSLSPFTVCMAQEPPAVTPTPAVDRQAPAAPQGLKLTTSKKFNRLTWRPNSETDLAGYNVYRSVKGSNVRTKLNTALITRPDCIDKSIKRGKTYIYYVSAVDRAGNESPTTSSYKKASKPSKPKKKSKSRRR